MKQRGHPKIDSTASKELEHLSEQLNPDHAYYSYQSNRVSSEEIVFSRKKNLERTSSKTIKMPFLSTSQFHVSQEPAVSNSWQLTEALSSNTESIYDMDYYIYEVKFIPAVDHVDKQRKILLDGLFRNRMLKREFLDKNFGTCRSFDQNLLYSFDKNFDSNRLFMAKEDFGENHDVEFKFVRMVKLDKVPPLEVGDMLTHFVLNPLMVQGGFYKSKHLWFPSRRDVKIFDVHRREIPLAVVKGWHVVIKLVTAPNKLEYPVLAVVKCTREFNLQYARSLREQLEMELRGKTWEEFTRHVKRKYKDRRVYLSTSHRSLVIKDINFDRNESYVLAETGQTIAQYTAEKYNVRVQPKELCTVQDRGRSDYLPQFIYLSAQSDDAPGNYTEAMKYINIMPFQRQRESQGMINHLIDTLSQHERLRNIVAIASKPMPISLLHLRPCTLAVRKRGGPPDQKDYFNPEDLQNRDKRDVAWNRLFGGVFPNQGKPLQNWAIVYTDANKTCAEQFCKLAGDYTRARPFKVGFIKRPQTRELHIEDIRNQQSYLKVVKPTDELLVPILANSSIGSEMKRRFTKACHYPETQNYTQTDDSERGPPPQLQFMKCDNANNKNAVFGCMENCLLKMEAKLYEVHPPDSKKHLGITPTSIWAVGLDIAHVGKSVGCMSIIMDPFEGAIGSWRNYCCLLKRRQSIIAGRNTANLFYKALNEILETERQRYPTANIKAILKRILPKTIIIFRERVQDKDLKTCLREEIGGIDTAIINYQRRQRIPWKPKLQVIVSTPFCREHFTTIDLTQNILPNPGFPSRPVVMIKRTVLSPNYCDFLLLVSPWNQKTKPQRYIVLRDDMEWMLKVESMIGMFELIYAFTWTYPFMLPFSNGNMTKPAASKIAKHYAEFTANAITPDDKDLQHFTVPLPFRPQVLLRKNDIPPNPVGG